MKHGVRVRIMNSITAVHTKRSSVIQLTAQRNPRQVRADNAAIHSL